MKKKLESEDLKRIEKHLLDVLDSYCLDNDLRYFLTYGTLIGAVRHKGFIPWDDDIDIMMPRSDYDRLVASFNLAAADKNVRLLSHQEDPSYYLPIAKLIDTSTVLKEAYDVDYDMGVYIDIFPLDNLSDDISIAGSRLKKGLRLNKQLAFKTMKVRKGRSALKNAALRIIKLALAGKTISGMIDSLDSFCRESGSEGFTRYVGVLEGISLKNYFKAFDSGWFEGSRYAEFEGKMYPVPKETEKLLELLYGDYMQLPPAEQQVTHHLYEAWYKE